MGILIIYSLLYHINNKPNSLPSAYFKIQNLLKTMQQSKTPSVTRKPRTTKTTLPISNPPIFSSFKTL